MQSEQCCLFMVTGVMAKGGSGSGGADGGKSGGGGGGIKCSSTNSSSRCCCVNFNGIRSSSSPRVRILCEWHSSMMTVVLAMMVVLVKP